MQELIYGNFEPKESYWKAYWDYKDSKERKLTAKEELFQATKDLLSAKIHVSFSSFLKSSLHSTTLSHTTPQNIVSHYTLQHSFTSNPTTLSYATPD
jgi:hypothetical protein